MRASRDENRQAADRHGGLRRRDDEAAGGLVKRLQAHEPEFAAAKEENSKHRRNVQLPKHCRKA
ncbi:MAG: hypothetical protein ABW128_20100 [Rhizorhabdus sp.]|jgi:hypothetical protein